MKRYVKKFIVDYYYRFKYPNKIIETYLGIDLSHLEEFTTIRYHVELSNATNVGAFSLINKYSQITQLVDKIGRFTSIGPNVYIGASHHDYREYTSRGILDICDFLNVKLTNNVKESILKESALLNKKTTIGHDVWIGAKSIIMNGVKIGDGSVIGSGSIVTKDIPPYSIAVGSPAKIIKKRFSDEVIEKLIEKDFYSNDLNYIVKAIKKDPTIFRDLNKFLKA